MSETKSANASRTVEQWRARTRIPKTLKSGAEVILRKPRPAALIRASRLPMSLPLKVAEAKASGEQLIALQDAVAATPEQEIDSFVAFAEAIVTDVLVSPRVVVRAPGDNRPLEDDEVLLDEIPPDDFMEVYSWATSQGEGSTMRMGGEEVAAEAVERFEARSETQPQELDTVA